MSNITKVAELHEIPMGGAKVVTFQGEEIALFNVNGQIYATANSCAHQGGPLGEGYLEGLTITCPWHAWKYDVTTGKCPAIPSASVQSYKTKIDGNDIFIEA